MLIFNWVYNQSNNAQPEKEKLRRLISIQYPEIKKKIAYLAINWDKQDQKKIKEVFKDISDLFELHKQVMALLPDFSSYEDSQNQFLANYMIGDDGDLYIKTSEVIFKLNDLINNQKYNTDNVTSDMQHSFGFLKLLFKYLGIALVIGALLIAIFTTRSIVIPINKLKLNLLTLSKGVFPKSMIKKRSDEIGEMANALTKVISGLKRTKDFANAVGSGQFETHYEPLSYEDSLGKALLKMRDDLAENERVLEQKVVERTAEVVKQKEEIEGQNKKISELYEEVTDSIKYAKGLQEAILPPKEFIQSVLPNSFILYKPKDIVSGDFYWVEEKNNKIYFAAVDCTGHGVPGAFMSIVGYNALNEALRNNDQPGEILDSLNKGISKTLHNNAMGAKNKDGMDLALCCFDPKTNELEYAGAYNPLYILRNSEINQIKAHKYATHLIKLKKGDYIYIFSDGYADQFGGPKGKKFMYKRFRDYILTLNGKKMEEQKDYLNTTIEDWKGSLEQIDDILVIGMEVV